MVQKSWLWMYCNFQKHHKEWRTQLERNQLSRPASCALVSSLLSSRLTWGSWCWSLMFKIGFKPAFKNSRAHVLYINVCQMSQHAIYSWFETVTWCEMKVVGKVNVGVLSNATLCKRHGHERAPTSGCPMHSTFQIWFPDILAKEMYCSQEEWMDVKFVAYLAQ